MEFTRHWSRTGILVCILYAGAVAAQNEFDLGDLEAGQLLLNLSATEQTEVEQDTLTTMLEYSTQGKDKTAIQNEVNTAMKDVAKVLDATGDVDSSIQQYQVYIIQPGRPARADIENPVWRAQQSVRLTGKNSGAILELAGKLQEKGLNITGMFYSLSTERYEEVSDSLMQAALEKLQTRANAAAAALGKQSAELVEVSLNGNQNFLPRAMAASVARDSLATIEPPEASPGQTQVSLTVSARALLSP